MHLDVDNDRTTTIRASVIDAQQNMVISILLVIVVVFFFLRNWRATLIPSVVVPVSLIGTFGAMYLLGYNLDNLSLMALTIATGFVVDDAIVVIENITRHMELGMKPMQAALKGASEIGFTVLSMSVSLMAVFIPILMMSGIVGRLFREFAVVLSVAIFISMVDLADSDADDVLAADEARRTTHGWFYQTTEKFFEWIISTYAAALGVVLKNSVPMMLVMAADARRRAFISISRSPRVSFRSRIPGGCRARSSGSSIFRISRWWRKRSGSSSSAGRIPMSTRSTWWRARAAAVRAVIRRRSGCS